MAMWQTFVWVGVGSFFGGGMRYLVGRVLEPWAGALPLGTMVVNVLGSCLLGALLAYAETRGLEPWMRALFVVGFCGGFTTFSTFTADAFALLRAGELALFGLYALGGFSVALMGLMVGYYLVRSLT